MSKYKILYDLDHQYGIGELLPDNCKVNLRCLNNLYEGYTGFLNGSNFRVGDMIRNEDFDMIDHWKVILHK